MDRLRVALGAAVASLGALVLVGWLGEITRLTQLRSDFASLKASTALCLLALGLALAVPSALTRWLAALGGGYAAVVLVEYAAGADWGVDDVLGLDDGGGPHPGRMALTSAACVLLLAVGLWSRGLTKQVTAHVALLLSGAALVGYAYGVPRLYSVSVFSTMALHAAVGLAALSVGVLLTDPDRGLVALLVSESAGGMLVRRLLPGAVLVPVAGGALVTRAAAAGWISASDAPALLSLGVVAAAVVTIYVNGLRFRRLDLARVSAETALEERDELTGQLLRAEERLRRVLETAGDAYIAIDEHGRVIDWNREATATFGHRREDVLGRSLDELIIPRRFREAHLRGMERFLATGAGPILGQRLELAALHRDGHELPVELVVWAIEDGPGRYQVQAFVRDITARKRAEEALQASEQRSRMAAEHAPVGLALVAIDGSFVEVNPALCRLLGRSAEELMGLTFQDITHPDDVVADLTRVDQLLRGEIRSYAMEKRYLHKDGQEIWVRLHVALVRDELGAPSCFISQVEDISEHRAAQQALVEANAELTEFASVAAHDLRAPLHAMTGFAHLLQRVYGEQLDPQAAEWVQRIVDGGKRGGALIDELLSVARLSRAEPRMETVALEELLHDVAADERMAHAERQAVIAVEGKVPDVRGDETQLRQVFTNLIGNACTFVPPDRRPEVTVTADLDADGRVLVEVTDNGVGIPVDDREAVFAMFHRLRSDFAGTGIGLAVCKKVVERHGGRIWVADGPEGGTKMCVILPCA